MSKPKTGLDRSKAEKSLESFLDLKNEAKVFVLKGEWGVGKTHLVKEFLSKKGREYYYGSVFGISSINELKMQLWSNFQPIKKEEKGGIFSKLDPRKMLKHTEDNSEVVKTLIEKIPFVGDIGSGATSAAISLISHVLINEMLKGQIICIDDLERRSKKLNLDELLGFVESLTEEINSKIIIIYYEGKINEDPEAENILREYREKVIDIEIELSPNADENFYIGFGKDDPDEKIIFNYLNREYIQTNNIRVLKKLRQILDSLRPQIKDFLPSVREQIIEEAIFITLAKFDKKFPVKLNDLLALGGHSKALVSKNKEDGNLYLSAINLGYSESLISEDIIRLVETSVYDCKRLIEKGKQLNEKEEQNKINEALTEACIPLFESFCGSEQELHSNLMQFLEKYCPFLDFPALVKLEDIANAVSLDLPKYKKIWLEYQIDKFETSEISLLKSIILKDFPDLMTKLEEKISRFEQTMDITQILIKLRRNDFLSEEEVTYLNGRTVENYKQWLLEKHSDKYYIVKQALGKGGDFSQTIEQAMAELAHKSELNALRARKLYNVDIKNEDLLQG